MYNSVSWRYEIQLSELHNYPRMYSNQSINQSINQFVKRYYNRYSNNIAPCNQSVTAAEHTDEIDVLHCQTKLWVSPFPCLLRQVASWVFERVTPPSRGLHTNWRRHPISYRYEMLSMGSPENASVSDFSGTDLQVTTPSRSAHCWKDAEKAIGQP